MLDIKRIRDNPKELEQALCRRGNKTSVAQLIELDKKRREPIARLDELRSRQNKASEEIGRLKKQGKDASEPMKGMDELKAQIKQLEKAQPEADAALEQALLTVPNYPDASIPDGKGPDDNKVVREVGEKHKYSFTPKDHHAVGEALGILDFATATKLSGARFPLLRGQGAALERAIISFMLDVHTKEHGYKEIFPPFLVTAETMAGTGQLPKFAEELYRCERGGGGEDGGNDLYLIPTAEVPLTNMHRGDTIPEEKLPLKYCAYTACFRREAGSYGKDTRGLIRNHQFNKVELVRFSRPEDSMKNLEELTADAEEILKRLEIPYRVIVLCAFDLGFGSAKTYDLEVWMPGENKWREISSCSNFTDFQARRMNIRLQRLAQGKRELLHTLNGSGVAVGRTFAAILENYQNPDGTVDVPKVLRPYLGADKICKEAGNG